MIELETERLILRRWRQDDIEPLGAIHSDSEVMEWLGQGPMPPEENAACVARYEAHFDANGFGLWAVERKSDAALIGVAGLRRLASGDHQMAPCVEAAWRQARWAWGHGYISEAARAAVEDGLQRVELDAILAWTAVSNRRSQAVMRRIGMVRDASRDFDHQRLPAGHPLRRHVVFAIWQ